MEVMIAVAIIAIVASVALPQYQQYIIKGRRADATTAIMKISAEQEKYYLDNNTYFDDAEFNLIGDQWFSRPSGALISKSGFYKLEIQQDGLNDFTSSFLVVATPIGTQANDKQCTSIRINGSGQRTATPVTSNCWK